MSTERDVRGPLGWVVVASGTWRGSVPPGKPRVEVLGGTIYPFRADAEARVVKSQPAYHDFVLTVEPIGQPAGEEIEPHECPRCGGIHGCSVPVETERLREALRECRDFVGYVQDGSSLKRITAIINRALAPRGGSEG